MNKNYEQIFDNFTNHSIITVGDIMLDKYIWGKVNRISPEAPVPVVNTQETEYRIGGAGNVAANLSALDCNSTLLAVTGEDSNSSLLKKLLNEADITPLFQQDSQRPTTLKSRIVSQQQQLLRIDRERTRAVSDKIIKNSINQVRNLNKVDALVISDYDKGFVTQELIQKISASFQNIPIVIDPKVRDWEKYRGASIIKPNYKEFCQALNRDEVQLTQLEKYAGEISNKFQFKAIIVTLGENGVFYYTRNDSAILPTQAHEVYDVSGAGDTFTAAFTASYLSTDNIKIAAQIANFASAVAVEKVGTATVSADEILKKIN